MVALEMAAHLQAEACFLIASVRAVGELPWSFRVLRPIAPLGPERLGRVAGVACRLIPSRAERTNRRLTRLSEPSSTFLRWATWATLTWRPSPESRDVRVYQIHGTEDRTIPASCTSPDELVAGAGHLLPLTHAEAVNEFIRRRVENHCQV